MPAIRYTHTPRPQLTVGQLRAALDGLPDDQPVMVQFGDGHPRRGLVDWQPVIEAGVQCETHPDGTVIGDDNTFWIVADFQTGEYEYVT